MMQLVIQFGPFFESAVAAMKALNMATVPKVQIVVMINAN
jgi:hypothetical protein